MLKNIIFVYLNKSSFLTYCCLENSLFWMQKYYFFEPIIFLLKKKKMSKTDKNKFCKKIHSKHSKVLVRKWTLLWFYFIIITVFSAKIGFSIDATTDIAIFLDKVEIGRSKSFFDCLMSRKRQVVKHRNLMYQWI